MSDGRFRRIRTLLVEDNLDDVEITQRAFRRSGVETDLTVLRDGKEAIDYLVGGAMRVRPDLVLLDINLPRADGLEVLASVRATSDLAGMPVVILTASAREEDVRRSYSLCANSYIQKPVVFEEFLEALNLLARYWHEIVTLPSEA